MAALGSAHAGRDHVVYRSGSVRRARLACALPHFATLTLSCFAHLLREMALTQRLRPSLRLSSLSLKLWKLDGYQVGAGSPKDPWNPVHGNPGPLGADWALILGHVSPR